MAILLHTSVCQVIHLGATLTNLSMEWAKMFKYLGVPLSHDLFGVNMFNQSAVNLGRSLAFSTRDSITMLQVVIYFNSVSPLLSPISIVRQSPWDKIELEDVQ